MYSQKFERLSDVYQTHADRCSTFAPFHRSGSLGKLAPENDSGHRVQQLAQTVRTSDTDISVKPYLSKITKRKAPLILWRRNHGLRRTYFYGLLRPGFSQFRLWRWLLLLYDRSGDWSGLIYHDETGRKLSTELEIYDLQPEKFRPSSLVIEAQISHRRSL